MHTQEHTTDWSHFISTQEAENNNNIKKQNKIKQEQKVCPGYKT